MRDHGAASSGLTDILRRLTHDGAAVADSEIKLVRSDMAGLIRKYAVGLALALLGFMLLNIALIVLAGAGAFALQPYFTSPVTAFLVMGALVVLLAGVSFAVGVWLLLRKPAPRGLILQWIFGSKHHV